LNKARLFWGSDRAGPAPIRR